MAKEIDRAGLPVVHMCTIVPISLTVGANRIVPTIAIPHPLGNPDLSSEQEKELRMMLVKSALTALQTNITKQTVFKEEQE
jgi:glycine reductase